MKKLLLLLSFLMVIPIATFLAQLPPIAPPNIFTPHVQIFLSPDGNDENDGTRTSPVSTFQKAITLIEFDVNADVYGEIVYLQGDYYPAEPLRQTVSHFQSGNYRKNISIVGEGEVNIYGDNMRSGTHLLHLRGSHIRVENINLYNAQGTGILLQDSRNGKYTSSNLLSDVLVKDIFIDFSYGHSLITTFAQNVMYDNITAVNGQQANTGTEGNCQWGSAVKVYMVKNVIIKNCLVYHNRGEGINTQACTNVLVENNISYDNFAGAIYCTRTNNAIYRKNLLFNMDSIYWRDCHPAGNAQRRKPPTGISIANEVDVANGYDMTDNQQCHATRGHENNTFRNKIADSIFIYNNILIMSGIGLNDESYGSCVEALAAYNNFSNIFIENNTIIGDIAPDHPYRNDRALIRLTMNQTLWHGCIFTGIDGKGAYRFENFVLKNNIFSQSDSASPAHNIGAVLYGGRPCNGGNLEDKISSAYNLWHHNPFDTHDYYGNKYIPNPLKGSSDIFNDKMITACNPLLSLDILTPSTDTEQKGYELYIAAPVSDYIVDDFYGTERPSGKSNVGAVILQKKTEIIPSTSEPQNFTISPNPSHGHFKVVFKYPIEIREVRVFNALGMELPFHSDIQTSTIEITLKDVYNGLIFFHCRTENGILSSSLLVH